jgi:hypothetical protein
MPAEDARPVESGRSCSMEVPGIRASHSSPSGVVEFA